MEKPIATTVMLPPEMRRWLQAEAEKQTRSLSQQILHMVSQQRADIEVKAREVA